MTSEEINNEAGMSLREAYDYDEKTSGKGGGFFSLKNDKDTGVVRFLYESDQDMDYAFVHRVKIDGKDRIVECLGRDAGCPLCQSGNRSQLKLYLQLEHDGQVKVWERGKTFIPTMLSISERYAPLFNKRFEIERNGKAGDMKTTYQMFIMQEDEEDKKQTLEDIKAKKIVLKDGKSKLILQLTPEEMMQAIDGTFTLKQDGEGDQGQQQEQNPQRRGEAVGGNGEQVF